jgi:hypothetical protein
VHPRILAKRLRKSSATIHRVMLEQRGAMLRALGLEPESPAADAAGAKLTSVVRLLAPDSVRLGLGLPGATSVPEFIARAEAGGWPDAKAERERALALAFLRHRAARAIAALPKQGPSAARIDAIITDLRWMSRLKVELIRGQGMLLLKTIEGRVGRTLGDLPPVPAARVLLLALEAMAADGGPVDRFDPGRGGRLAAPAGIALNRAISRWTSDEGAVWTGAAPDARRQATPDAPARATRIAPTAPVPLRDWTRGVTRWQEWTEPHPRLRDALDHAEQDTRLLLAKRYGLLISPPMSLADLAKELLIRPEQVRQRERKAVRLLLDAGPDRIDAPRPGKPPRRRRPGR